MISRRISHLKYKLIVEKFTATITRILQCLIEQQQSSLISLGGIGYMNRTIDFIMLYHKSRLYPYHWTAFHSIYFPYKRIYSAIYMFNNPWKKHMIISSKCAQQLCPLFIEKSKSITNWHTHTYVTDDMFFYACYLLKPKIICNISWWLQHDMSHSSCILILLQHLLLFIPAMNIWPYMIIIIILDM